MEREMRALNAGAVSRGRVRLPVKNWSTVRNPGLGAADKKERNERLNGVSCLRISASV